MEGTGTCGVVAVLTVGNILGLGGMTGDVGVPGVAKGFVADCTVGCWGGKLTSVAVVGGIGGVEITNAGNVVGEGNKTAIVTFVTVN